MKKYQTLFLSGFAAGLFVLGTAMTSMAASRGT